MSYGYIRKMSEAARSERERRRKRYRLRNISVAEVSSVTAGASGNHDGIGNARVVLRKRDDGHEKESREMQVTETGSRGASAMSIAKRSWEAAQEGRLSEYDLNTVMKEITRFYFDGNLPAMLSSEVGKIFLQPRTMRKSAAEEAELLQKRLRENYDRQDEQRQPIHNNEAAAAVRAERTAAAIKHHMDNGDSYEVAASKVHRAEKEAGVNERRLNTGPLWN
jgi:hypothetical protein